MVDLESGPDSDTDPNTDPEPTPDSRHLIWFVIWPGVQSLDLTGPHEVFDAANRVADRLDRGGARYRLRVLSLSAGEVPSESGLRIGADCLAEAVAAATSGDEPFPDTVMLPGGDGVHDAAADPELIRLVARVAEAAPRLATVCTGTFLAAAAGVLTGKKVATHWARASRLAENHPDIQVDAESLYLCDGDTWSSAGVAAGIDLALAMVERDHDAEVAQIAARWLVVHLRRPGGQSQFAAPVWARPSPVEPIRRAQERIQADPGACHTVAELAAAAGLSARHFTRLFAAEVGRTPARFVEQVRVEAARRELEAGRDNLAGIAGLCGFGTTETMRRAFQRRLGVAPDDYRRRFHLSSEGRQEL